MSKIPPPSIVQPLSRSDAVRMRNELVEEMKRKAPTALKFQYAEGGVDGTDDFLLIAAPSETIITERAVIRLTQPQALSLAATICNTLAQGMLLEASGALRPGLPGPRKVD